MHLTIRLAVAKMVAVHARSASFPGQHSHPALARLDDSIRELRSWLASSSSSGKAGQASGLAHVNAVLAALGELLALPQAVAALHDTATCDEILDKYLALADAYGMFQLVLVTLKQRVAELQVDTWRGDAAAVAASLRSHRKTEKGMCRLAAMMRHTLRSRSRPTEATNSEDVIGIVTEATAATMEASEAIFLGCAAMSPDVPAMVYSVSPNKWLSRLSIRPSTKKAEPETVVAALERLEQLEESIGGLERGSEKVFRRLLQSRVSLLNIQNPF